MLGQPRFKRRLLEIALGVACFALALTLRHLAGAWFESRLPYLVFFIATIAAAYLWGAWAALTTAVLAAALSGYDSPTSGLILSGLPGASVSVGAFLVAASLCALLISGLREARDHLELERKRYAELAENRDLMYRELQHRVFNSIQVAAGLLRAQAETASPVDRHALIEAAGRITLVGKIQRELHDQAGAPTPFADFARDLAAQALSAAGAERIEVQIQGGESPLHPTQVMPVALVLLECVNNALEHAFAGGRTGSILIALNPAGERARLTIRDDGAGPSESFSLERSPSLGLKIVRAMASQIHGEFTLSRADPGTTCELAFPMLAPHVP
jgi:two-component sensor histidine kinase